MIIRMLGACAAALLAVSAWAVEPFVVKDIRIEGIQRIEAGTVFSYLPIKVGDTVNEDKASAAIKALYATGFFQDVRLEQEQDVLVVVVEERPAISEINIAGSKEFEKDALKTGLKQVGLAESRIFDRALLDRSEQELKRQYISRGFYAMEVATTVTPLDRNRVGINFNIVEGEVAKIRQIRVVGNAAFSEKELLREFSITTPGLLTWYTKSDQYSKQKLAGDLETLRSFYLNRGYLEFAVDSTQVSITPDKRDIYITVNVTEGPKYTVSEIKMAGEMLVPEEELRKLIQLKPGEVFSRQRLTESTKAMSDRLGNEGYAFANINAAPELNKEKQEVAFTFFVDPGRRVYVRRVNITGNTKTRDEVVRRELRQLEGAWYSGDNINESKRRLDLTGFFKETSVETPAVAGTTDQVDINFNVEEQPTGAVLLGAGFSSSDGIVLSGSVQQNNFLGTGNSVAVAVNSGSVNTLYSFSFTDPFWTVDGISRGFDLFKRDVDSSNLNVGQFSSSTLGANFRLGVPVTAKDTIQLGLGVEKTDVDVFNDSPQRFISFVDEFGRSNLSVPLTVGWARDTRDSALVPTSGTVQRASAEWATPVGDLEYYKLSYAHRIFYPLTRDFTLTLNGEAGFGDGIGGQPLPFFKNFFVGGIASVRGFETASIGPRDTNDDALGGDMMLLGGAEVLFPVPGLRSDKSARLSVFLDSGYVSGNGGTGNADGVRFSTGVGMTWLSPLGPLRFGLGFPINKKKGDRTEPFQFQLGRTF